MVTDVHCNCINCQLMFKSTCTFIIHIGTACMAFVSAITDICTLYHADASQFTGPRDKVLIKQWEKKIGAVCTQCMKMCTVTVQG